MMRRACTSLVAGTNRKSAVSTGEAPPCVDERGATQPAAPVSPRNVAVPFADITNTVPSALTTGEAELLPTRRCDQRTTPADGPTKGLRPLCVASLAAADHAGGARSGGADRLAVAERVARGECVAADPQATRSARAESRTMASVACGREERA